MNIIKSILVIIGTAIIILTFFTKDYTRATYILMVLLWSWKLLDWNSATIIIRQSRGPVCVICGQNLRNLRETKDQDHEEKN